MYERIIVPLDGTPFAAQAVPYARVIGDAVQATVELCGAVESLGERIRDFGLSGYAQGSLVWTNATIDAEKLEQSQDRVHKRARKALEIQARRLEAAGIPTEIATKEGDPAHVIAAEAHGHADTLVVMATHGKFGVLQWFNGSITREVVRLVHAPVLAIPAQEGRPPGAAPIIRRVLLPLDRSPLAEEAVPHAAALANALEVPLEVLLAEANVGSGDGQDDRTPQAYLHDILASLHEQGVRDLRSSVVPASAGEAIVGATGDTREVIVAMATHGRSGLARLLLGSVADYVVQHSQAPVLLVRP